MHPRNRREHQFATVSDKMAWEIQEIPVLIKGKESDTYKALVRSDNDGVLNIVKKSYVPLRNDELTKVVEKLSGFTKMKIEGYSEWDNGGKIIAQLQGTEKLKVGDFPIESTMLIGNTFDYSSAFFIGTSTNLIRCSNSFGLIHKSMKIQHTKLAEFKREELMTYFNLYADQSKSILQNMERMIAIKASTKMQNEMINHVLDIKKPLDEISMKKRNQRTELEGAIKREIDEVGSSLFGLFNGVTYYTSHIKELKGGRQKSTGNVFGTLAQINNKAYEYALELVK